MPYAAKAKAQQFTRRKPLNKNKREIYIKEEDKILLFTKNLTSDKLNILYMKAFRVREVKKITIILKLSNIKIYFKFYVFLLKKVLLNTLKTKF